MRDSAGSRRGRARRWSWTLGILRRASFRWLMDLLCGKVSWIMLEAVEVLNNRKGLAHSSLPQFVRAHAKHVLSSPAPTRQMIDLFPHALIATKKVNSAKLRNTTHMLIYLLAGGRSRHAADLHLARRSCARRNLDMARVVRGPRGGRVDDECSGCP